MTAVHSGLPFTSSSPVSEVPGASAGRAQKNFRRIQSVIARRWWVIAVCVTVGAVAGVAVSLATTPQYKSQAVLYATSATDTNAQSAYQGSLASQQRMVSYAELALSEVVLRKAIDDNDLPLAISDARSKLTVTSKPGTVLLTIAAVDSDSVEAALLANAVAQSMVDYVASLERPIDGGRPVAALTVITPASPSGKTVTPNTLLNIVLGLLGGLAVAAVLLVAFYRLDTRVRNEEDLESTGLGPVLATVPNSDELGSDRAADFAGGASPTAEAYRRLRTNLKFVTVDAASPRILVTSPAPGDGKTTTAVNLALALAELGRRVVLVGADLRKPGLGSRLPVNGAVGLTDYLNGDAEILDVIQPSGFRNLDVLASGPVPPNPGELLASERARRGFDVLGERYDHVVVDSPPLLPVSDAMAVGQWMNGVLLVARAGRTGRPQIEQAANQMELARLKVLGCVLNDVPTRDTAYAYAYYGSESSRAEVTTGHHNRPTGAPESGLSSGVEMVKSSRP
ncbi:polysaccharide biosynthesis tyrosine autokinase [Gordonia aurantiaca]|uniref:polysaccharide biosynthesis tyrosine autokinase n=1 Tax=Gordonia sp. B21 TaxID=3151852 RepID=UPI0032664D81